MRWRGPLIVAGVAALLALCTLTTGPAGAGNCGYGYPVYCPPRYYPPAYCAPAPYCASVAVAVKEPPVIVQPVVLEQILAPAVVFQTLSAYQVPTAAGFSYTGQKGSYGGGQQFQAPAAAATPKSPGYGGGYGSGGGAASGGLSDADLDALAARLAVKLGGGGAQQADPVPRIGGNGNGNGNDQGKAPPQQRDGDLSPGLRAAIDYMGSACVECHQQKAQGGVTLFTPQGDFRPTSTRKQLVPADVYEAMVLNMPLGGKKPPAEVMAALREAGWDRR